MNVFNSNRYYKLLNGNEEKYSLNRTVKNKIGFTADLI
jgi:hypothetical protein